MWLLLFCLGFNSARAQQSESAPKHGDDVEGAPVTKIPTRNEPGYEDWSTPTLPPGMSSEVVPLQKDEHLGFTRELVHAQWRSLDPIDLWVIRPAGVKNPPVILYLYSYPSDNDRYKDLKFCEFLTRNGFGAVGFVSALTGPRYHDIATKEWFVSQLQASLGASVHDVQLILNYLNSRRDFDITRVGMWGDGSGASIAIMAAAVDPRIKALDLLDPWGDWPNWFANSTLVPEGERASYLKPEFLKKLENLEPLKLLPQLKTQQVRIEQIDSVTVTPPLVREHLAAAAAANAKTVRYPTTKAFFTEVAGTGKAFDWLKEQLAPASGVANSTPASTRSKGSQR